MGGGGGGVADAAFKADVDDSLPGAGADRESSDYRRATTTGGDGGGVFYFAKTRVKKRNPDGDGATKQNNA